MDSKICSYCKIEKPVTEFRLRSGCPNTLKSQCNECDKNTKRKHYERNKDRFKLRREIKKCQISEYLRTIKNCECADCGQKFPYYVMDFDHRPNERKEFAVSQWAKQVGTSWKKIKAEVAKCDVVCSNCHRLRTYTRGY